MRLRAAAAEDAPALAALHARAFDRPWGAAEIARLMTAMGGFAVLAESETGASGFILARAIGGEAEILTLAVDPSVRRSGIGAALVEAAAGLAAQGGADALFLEVAADNHAALALYARTGFRQAGQRRAYYPREGTAPVDALVLRRALNTPSP